MEAIIITILAAILVIIIANIKIVPQAHEHVVEFLGKYKTTWSAGIHVKIPVLERIAKKVTLKEQ
ncbi:MAG: peptidase, partial [Clostridia bacterium]|nr:peptidase [Clostridia bacterium]